MASTQTPLHSGFGPLTTAQEAVRGADLRGRIAIVTGGHSGLGLETSRVLSGAGATVVVPARDPAAARQALRGLAGVEVAALDLGDPLSVDAFAAAFVDGGRPLHMLVNSAGIMATPLARDARGCEAQFATNHLGHFQLTLRLWPALLRAQGARVVSVSSRGHFIGGVDFDDPQFKVRAYDKWVAYGQSKTANVLFAVGLDARGAAHGVRAFSLHPGTVLTSLARHLSNEELGSFGVSKETAHGSIPAGQGAGDGGDYKTIAQGAATAVWCAASPQLDGHGGVYCENVDIAPVVAPDDARRVGVRPWAVDPVLAERLWRLSAGLTGVDLA